MRQPRLRGRRLAAAGLALWFVAAGAAVAAERNLVVAATRAQPANEPRTALVIGNADYPKSPLANPVNDARAVAGRLQQLRFRVVLLENATQEQMYEAIRLFGDSLRAGGVGLFYFAGHALQVRGRNYLLPVNAKIEREDEILYRTVDTGQVLDKMESARNRVNVVILDACRNNPFGREFRSVSPGLAVMDAPFNTLIAFATAPGAVASDGAGRNGLYTQHLLQSLAEPGLALEDVFKRVRTGVRQESAGRQVPWENTSLEVDFYFDPLPHQLAAGPPSTPDPLTVELAFWDSIKGSADADDFRAYLQRYPDGQFAALAQNRLRWLTRPPAPPVAQTAALPPPGPPSAAAAAGVPPAAPAASEPRPPATVALLPPQTPARPPPAPPPLPPGGVAGEAAPAPTRTLQGHTADVLAATVSPNGRQALSGGSDRSLRLWDLASGRELRVLLGHQAAVTAAAFAADGRQLLSGGADGSVRLWDAATGSEVARLAGHAAAVNAVALAPTARYAVSAADDGELALWELPSGRPLQRARGDDRRLLALALSADGRHLLTGADDGTLRLRDVGGLRVVRRFDLAPAGADAAAVVAVGISHDGSHIGAVYADGTIASWDLRSGALRHRVATGLQAPVRAALAPDGAAALVAGTDGRLALWDIAGARALWQAGLGDRRRPAAVALGSGTGAFALVAVDDQLRLWPLPTAGTAAP